MHQLGKTLYSGSGNTFLLLMRMLKAEKILVIDVQVAKVNKKTNLFFEDSSQLKEEVKPSHKIVAYILCIS